MLTFSTGHGGALLDRTRGLLGQSRRLRRIAEWDYGSYFASREALLRHAGRGVEGARVLDLGCGQRFPALLLFHTFGARATGIDTDVVDPRFGAISWIRMIRVNGVRRFVTSLVRHVLFDREYFRELRRRAGRPLRLDGLDVRLMDARALGFPDAHFDLVHSNSVFEHLLDVPRTLQETARVLRPDGVASVVIHLFPSLSGGHHPEWAFPDDEPSCRVPPWDHLQERRFPAAAYLNRWREGDFLKAFEERFEILELQAYREGEKFLTPERERKLTGYTREELLKRAIRVVLRRR